MADDRKQCWLMKGCPSRTGACYSCVPDGDECPIWRWFKKQILLKEQEAVKPGTGHWIWLQNCANEGVYCSECQTKMFDRYPMKKKLSQFCGHCGAKMGDEVEER